MVIVIVSDSPYTHAMQTDWQKDNRSRVVPLQTWWSSNWRRYIPPLNNNSEHYFHLQMNIIDVWSCEYYRSIKAKTQETFYWLDCHIKCTKSPSNPHFNTMLFLCYYCEWSPQMLTVDMHLSKLYDLCTSTTYTVNLFNLILPQWQPYKPLWPTKGQVDSKQNRWAAEAAPVWSLGEGRRETNQPGTSWDTPDQQTVMRHTVDIQKFFVLFI